MQYFFSGISEVARSRDLTELASDLSIMLGAGTVLLITVAKTSEPTR